MLKEDGNKKKIVIVEKANYLDYEQLSEGIIEKIQETEEIIECPIGELDFQYIIINEAKAYAIRDKKNGLFLKELTCDFEEENARWTNNLRDALIFDDERKGRKMTNLLVPRMNYEVIPLIYQVDPLFKSEK